MLASGAAAAGLVIRPRASTALLAAGLLGGALSGWAGLAVTEAALTGIAPEGPVRLQVVVATDPLPGRHGDWMLASPERRLVRGRWVAEEGPELLVSSDELPALAAGDRATVAGEAVPGGGTVSGRIYAGRVRAHTVERISGAVNPVLAAANHVRWRVWDRLGGGEDPAAALLAGFLIGDTTQMDPGDVDALQAAGLSHFVAVSGSNVALFLAVWWVVAGPLAQGPRRRAMAGIGGLLLFVVVTRWQPSVLRAAGMAVLVLVGRAFGLSISAWTALGLAVTGTLLAAGRLAADIGFQLSVAATVGILVGGGVISWVRPHWVGAALGATVAAQVAVTPLLLARFGSVPLASPLTNLVAAPLVAAATSSGGVGVLTGYDPLVRAAVSGSGLVLQIAHIAAPLPRLDVWGVLAGASLAALALRPRWRPAAALGGAVVLLLAIGPVAATAPPAAVFLDVGQGDSILLLGADGGVVLVDGGPEGSGIVAKLAAHGVARIDLLVLTHPHEDHAAGLSQVIQRLPVGRFWHSGYPQPGEQVERLFADAGRRGIPVEVPEVGRVARVGGVGLRVLGPERRFDSMNDHSLVILAELDGTTLLLTGDIEVVAQRELGPVPADVLKVPHQGGATSDLAWLAASAGRVAVISVGPNDFGHPSPDVIAVLEGTGSEVLRTDEMGDVVVRPARWARSPPETWETPLMEPRRLDIGGSTHLFDGSETWVMGVLNLSPESRNQQSFVATPQDALAGARLYRRWGVDLVDLGAQSSHYEAPTLDPDEEWRRMEPTLRLLVDDGFLVSIDTWKPAVAERAIDAGAVMVNDTGGLQDERMADLVMSRRAAAVLTRLDGANPHAVSELEVDEQSVSRIVQWLRTRLEAVGGLAATNLVVDPGIAINYPGDYQAYTALQLDVIRSLDRIRALGRPVLVPIPRKRETARTMAYITLALENGADLIRVHDVEEAADLVRLFGRERRR